MASTEDKDPKPKDNQKSERSQLLEKIRALEKEITKNEETLKHLRDRLQNDKDKSSD